MMTKEKSNSRRKLLIKGGKQNKEVINIKRMAVVTIQNWKKEEMLLEEEVVKLPRVLAKSITLNLYLIENVELQKKPMLLLKQRVEVEIKKVVTGAILNHKEVKKDQEPNLIGWEKTRKTWEVKEDVVEEACVGEAAAVETLEEEVQAVVVEILEGMVPAVDEEAPEAWAEVVKAVIVDEAVVVLEEIVNLAEIAVVSVEEAQVEVVEIHVKEVPVVVLLEEEVRAVDEEILEEEVPAVDEEEEVLKPDEKRKHDGEIILAVDLVVDVVALGDVAALGVVVDPEVAVAQVEVAPEDVVVQEEKDE
jgi:hypothetical protein